MPMWPSPLHIGDHVLCNTGLEVEILETPYSLLSDSYCVRVRILMGPGGSTDLLGRQLQIYHSSPGRFGASIFVSINGQPLPDAPCTPVESSENSLEEEFFGRTTP